MRAGTCPGCKCKVKIPERQFRRITSGKKTKLIHNCGGMLFGKKLGWTLILKQITGSRDSRDPRDSRWDSVI